MTGYLRLTLSNALWLAVVLTMCCAIEGQAQEDKPFVFTVFGDTRPAGEIKRLSITRALIQDMLFHRPELVLGTGDYIDGSGEPELVRAQFERFFWSIQPLNTYGKIPVAMATGNHDISDSVANARIFEEYFGGRYYSINRGNAHFIILDSEIPGQAGCIKGEQLKWLREDLSANNGSPFIFVVVHQPLFPVGVHIGSSLDVDVPARDRLHELFVQYQVTAVFQGHEHLYNYQRRDGIDYFITGGGGAPLYADSTEGGFYHYLLVRLQGASYRVEVKHPDI